MLLRSRTSSCSAMLPTVRFPIFVSSWAGAAETVHPQTARMTDRVASVLNRRDIMFARVETIYLQGNAWLAAQGQAVKAHFVCDILAFWST